MQSQNFLRFSWFPKVDLRRFGLTFVATVAPNLFFLLFFFPSIDDEFSAFRQDSFVWVGQGRWVGWAVEGIAAQPVVPVVSYLVFFACLAYAIVLMGSVVSLRKQSDLLSLLPAAIFAAFPTLWLLLIFKANVLLAAVGYVSAALACFHTIQLSRSEKRKRMFRPLQGLVAVFFLVVAIASYQSFLLLFVASAFGVAIVSLLRREKISFVAVQLGWAAAVSATALALYLMVDSALKIIFNPDTTYVDTLFHLRLLSSSPSLTDIGSVARDVINTYLFSPNLFGKFLPAMVAMLVLGILAILVAGRKRLAPVALSLLGLLLAPFFFNLLTLSSMPLRSLVALPFIFWFLSAITLDIFPIRQRALALFALFPALLSTMFLTAEYGAAAILRHERDLIVASSVHERAANCGEDLLANESIKLLVHGALPLSTPYAEAKDSTAQSSFFNRVGEAGRLKYFFALHGLNVEIGSAEQVAANQALFEKMEAWPSPESTQCTGNSVLVKLGQ